MHVGSPSVTSLTSNRSTSSLTCTSVGGPATTVTWRKNGQLLIIDGNPYQQSQIIIDSISAMYNNILHSDNPGDLVGSFTCTVNNARGSDSMSMSTNGITQ